MTNLALSSSTLQIELGVTKMKVKRVLKRLSRGKALGPDGIPNKVLTLLAPDISADLAQAVSSAFIARMLPSYLKKSITLAL
jgi:hypothetical protein